MSNTEHTVEEILTAFKKSVLADTAVDNEVGYREAIEAINALRRADMEAVIGVYNDPLNHPHKLGKNGQSTCWGCPKAGHNRLRNELRDEQTKVMEERLNG